MFVMPIADRLEMRGDDGGHARRLGGIVELECRDPVISFLSLFGVGLGGGFRSFRVRALGNVCGGCFLTACGERGGSKREQDGEQYLEMQWMFHGSLVEEWRQILFNASLDVGALTNSASRFYRIRVVQ
jgi:hypothetical protein